VLGSGTLLELLELDGPEAVTEQLSQLPSGHRKELVRTVLASGFPVPETLEDFRTLVATAERHRLTVLTDDRGFLTVAAVTGQAGSPRHHRAAEAVGRFQHAGE
jgi:hypothetical protein